jgi:hypothetical protein
MDSGSDRHDSQGGDRDRNGSTNHGVVIADSTIRAVQDAANAFSGAVGRFEVAQGGVSAVLTGEDLRVTFSLDANIEDLSEDDKATVKLDICAAIGLHPSHAIISFSSGSVVVTIDVQVPSGSTSATDKHWGMDGDTFVWCHCGKCFESRPERRYRFQLATVDADALSAEHGSASTTDGVWTVDSTGVSFTALNKASMHSNWPECDCDDNDHDGAESGMRKLLSLKQLRQKVQSIFHW